MSARDAGILLGVQIDRKSLGTATTDALTAIERRGPPVIFACANPHSLASAQADSAFKSALNNASLVVADGVGVTIMAKFAGIKVGPRITGTDYFFSLMQALQARGAAKVFFFGSSHNVLNLISERMQREFPLLELCGTISPPYRPCSAEEDAAMVASINNVDPDVLWVGMTAPKQEKWVDANRHQLHVPVIASIGAVFDFYAGVNPRAPRWMCKAGIEWVYRLFKAPRRMWRRTFVSAPKFVALVIWRHLLGMGT